jgi:CIC family chloride channel protein
LRHGLEGEATSLSLGEVASPRFALARSDDIMFNVIGRMWRRNAIMSVVVGGGSVPRAGDVLGVITKEHVADSVAESIKPYSASEAAF